MSVLDDVSPGDRFGARLVIDVPDHGDKVAVKCDCGRSDLVNVYMLVKRKSDRCRTCSEEARSQEAITDALKRRALEWPVGRPGG